MMNRDRDRDSTSVKIRGPRVRTSASSTKLDTPKQSLPLVRSNTLPVNHTDFPRVQGLLDNEKARSDDGFHSDSDKDSNQSANSNISVHSNKSYLTRASSVKSVKSDVVVKVRPKVRPKSSLGTMSDHSLSNKSKVEHLDVFTSRTDDRQAEEARKNRKIEDLEISIRSLMKFNAELEASNKKQAEEIQELKRKLHINHSFMSIYGTDDDDDDDDDDVSTPLSEIDLEELKKDNDVRFRRICMVIDELIRDANDALNYTSKIGGSRVLTMLN